MLVAVSEELEADFLRQPAKGGEIDLSRDIPLAWLGEWVVEPLVILEREERPVCAMGGRSGRHPPARSQR